MKQFLIKYRHTTGTVEDWHREIASFIASLDGDPALKGKIGYRCMKGRDGADYYHLATVFDEGGADRPAGARLLQALHRGHQARFRRVGRGRAFGDDRRDGRDGIGL